MFGRSKSGFTFLELIVVIMLLGIIAAIVIPNMRYLMPGYKRKEFVTRFSGLVQFGWQNALITQKVHRVVIDLKKKRVKLEIETRKPEGTQEFYEPVKLTQFSSEFVWPDTLQIKQFESWRGIQRFNYYRLFEDYIDDFNKANLKVVKLIEPKPIKETTETPDSEINYPHFLIFKLLKVE